jgi:hypothetical protein
VARVFLLPVECQDGRSSPARIRNPSVLFDQTLHIVAPSDTGEEKVRKVYAYVAGLENQDYIPEPTLQEEKLLDLRVNRGADDVLEHHSGSTMI